MSKRTFVEAKDFVKPEDGLHKGCIVSVEDARSKSGYDQIRIRLTAEDEGEDGEPLYQYKDEDGVFQYATVLCSFNDKDGKKFSSLSDFGKLVSRLGIELVDGKAFETQDLVGVSVEYSTNTVPSNDGEGEFVNVARDSIKLVE